MKKAQPRRQHLLEVAATLFNNNGYHNTGVDTITKHSGVSKTTLYKYFDSKEEMILEILENQNHGTLEFIESHVHKSKQQQPTLREHQHIPAVFDAVKDWMSQKNFTGCNFINASAEFGKADDPIHHCAARHKTAVRTIILGLLSELPEQQAQSLAEQILILVDGAIVVAHVTMDKSTIDTARLTLNTLLAQHFPTV